MSAGSDIKDSSHRVKSRFGKVSPSAFMLCADRSSVRGKVESNKATDNVTHMLDSRWSRVFTS